MKRPGTYREGALDVLSGLMLFLALVLAGGYGPLSAQAPAFPEARHAAPSGAATGGQRTAPVLAKQQFAVAESRDVDGSGWGGDDPKALPASLALDLSPRFAHATGATRATFAPPVSPASSFDARAPPARS